MEPHKSHRRKSLNWGTFEIFFIRKSNTLIIERKLSYLHSFRVDDRDHIPLRRYHYFLSNHWDYRGYGVAATVALENRSLEDSVLSLKYKKRFKKNRANKPQFSHVKQTFGWRDFDFVHSPTLRRPTEPREP